MQVDLPRLCPQHSSQCPAWGKVEGRGKKGAEKGVTKRGKGRLRWAWRRCPEAAPESSNGRAWVPARAGRWVGGGCLCSGLCLVPCPDSPSHLGPGPPPASAGCQVCLGVAQGQALWGGPEQVAS